MKKVNPQDSLGRRQVTKWWEERYLVAHTEHGHGNDVHVKLLIGHDGSRLTKERVPQYAIDIVRRFELNIK